MDTIPRIIVDSVPFDSAALHQSIVSTVNTALEVIPPVNPVIDGLKYGFIALGGFITAHAIGYFRKRNKKK